jgi:erythromycin esterase-like protein
LGMPMFMLDLRARDLQTADGAWLAGPRSLRSVSYYYDPDSPMEYWYAQARLPNLFDAVVFLETSTPSTPLAFRYPPSF